VQTRGEKGPSRRKVRGAKSPKRDRLLQALFPSVGGFVQWQPPGRRCSFDWKFTAKEIGILQLQRRELVRGSELRLFRMRLGRRFPGVGLGPIDRMR